MAKETNKKQKKISSLNEEDAAATFLEKYQASTVLTLLQEVANHIHQQSQQKIEWNDLVEKTSTGISNAREYQMLWRHLAYGHALVEDLEDGAPLLDDDSDLECEREAFPPVSKETASEAAACVQVMIESLAKSEAAPTSTLIEAPLTINVPVCGSSRISNGSSQPSNLMQETNIIFPVTVQRHVRNNVSSTRAKKINGSVSDTITSIERKRNTLSEKEDIQLREGNCTHMTGKDEKTPIEKTPSELYKRWSILQKKGGGTN